MSFEKINLSDMNQLTKGQSLVLKTIIPNEIVNKYPGEIKLLQNMYQRAWIKFREMIPELRIGESNYEN